jgi:hypothetical protein
VKVHIIATQTRKNLSTKAVDKSADNLANFGFFRLFWQVSMYCLFFRQFFKLLLLEDLFLCISQTPDFINKKFTIVNMPLRKWTTLDVSQ